MRKLAGGGVRRGADASVAGSRGTAITGVRGEYVRPIVLFQAQNANDAVPPNALKQHLVSELHIPEEQIAIATGSERDLEGVEVSSPATL